jgi:hypothetical protein
MKALLHLQVVAQDMMDHHGVPPPEIKIDLNTSLA